MRDPQSKARAGIIRHPGSQSESGLSLFARSRSSAVSRLRCALGQRLQQSDRTCLRSGTVRASGRTGTQARRSSIADSATDRRRRQATDAHGRAGRAMSSAPLARPVVALLPPPPKPRPTIEVTAEYAAVPASEAYDEIIAEAARLYGAGKLQRRPRQRRTVWRRAAVPRDAQLRQTIKQILAATKETIGRRRLHDARGSA